MYVYTLLGIWLQVHLNYCLTGIDGHIVVASKCVDKLSIFLSGECVHEVKDVGLNKPFGIAVTDDGFIFVADFGNDRIVKL